MSKFLEKHAQKMLIDGQWVNSVSGNVLESHNPATGELIGTVPAGNSEDIDLAVVAARKAFESGPWSEYMPSQRTELLWNIADTISQHIDELAYLETLDQGKPLSHAQSEMKGVEGQYRFFAGVATKIEGETYSQSMDRHNPAGKKTLAYSLKEPVGVVAAIVPWNAPLILLAFKLAPALAAGCTVVVKPAELTSLSTLRFGELLIDAGVPAGVVNIVTGTGLSAGASLAAHTDVDKISFTGSTATGRAILEGAKSNLKKVALELGGKSPAIFLKDVNLAEAIPGAVRAITYNSGQICIAGSRLYAHASIYDELVGGIVEAFKKLKIGDGLDPATDIGPMVNVQQADKVKAYIDGAKADGAEIAVGGNQIGDTRCFIEPTVLENTRNDMACVQEEIFGPVLACQKFEDYDEIPILANDTIYGLGASVWTQNLSDAHRLAAKIRAGVVWINGHNVFDPAFPMGGYKASGWSRDSGSQAVENFLETKTVITLI
jgi:phenylacetaldehyde dehydrogenase